MAKRDPESIKRIQASVQESLETQERFFAEHMDSLTEAFDEVVRVLRNGGKLLIIGNGGSAADAQHLAADFVNARYIRMLQLRCDTRLSQELFNFMI